MKITSFCSYLSGGAGGSSLKLHQAFLKSGVQSKLYVKSASKEALNNVSSLYLLDKETMTENDLFRLPPKDDNGFNIISTGYGRTYDMGLQKAYAETDIVLLRWITDFISDIQISKWSALKKPVIWCLSDMAPFTGGCHYSFNCEGYTNSCSNCCMVSSSFKEHPSITLARRKKFWRNVTIVSPSNWLAECVKKSSVFKNANVHVIQTGVDLEIFKPVSITSVNIKKNIAVNRDKKYILFGADYQHDPRKGGSFLYDIASNLIKLGFVSDEIVFVFFGGFKKPIQHLFGFEVINLSFIDSQLELAEIYSFVDITVLPYIQDNLPNIMLESISCGTPVVAVDVGGMKDVIGDDVNGKLVALGDCNEMAISIKQLLNKPLSKNSLREFAVVNLNINIQVRKYIELFNRLL
jgi:glycosyltransferase involved in cell wall biosynthesis